MFRGLTVPVALALVSSLSSYAADPRIPISGPVVISQSGNYVVTRDFAAPLGIDAIRFADNVAVDIELNGHTISGPILVRSLRNNTPWCVSVSLRNGRLSNSRIQADQTFLGRTCNAFNWDQSISLERITLEGGSIDAGDTDLTITSSSLINTTLSSYRDYDWAPLKVTNSRLTNSSIRIGGGVYVEIYGNDFEHGGIYVNSSLYASSGLIAGNSIGFITVRDSFELSATHLQILRNQIEGAFDLSGIANSLISGNEIGGCTARDSAILFGGQRWGSSWNRIEDNVFVGDCAYGIAFGELTWGNTYSGNSFRTFYPDWTLDPERVLDEGTMVPPNRRGPMEVAPE